MGMLFDTAPVVAKAPDVWSAMLEMFLLEGLWRDALHTVMFDNNMRPISMWSSGGWDREGPWKGKAGSGVV